MSNLDFPPDWERRRHDPNDALYDFHDGTCDLDAEMLEPTKDGDEVVGLVLFADVDWTDPEAVTFRKAEWEELFPEEAKPGFLRRIADKVEDIFDRDDKES